MKFACSICLLLASYPVLTTASCVMLQNEFSCTETDTKNFWQELYRNMAEDERPEITLSISIKNSNFNVIDNFPNVPSYSQRYYLETLTIRNSSIEHISEMALENLINLISLDISENDLKNISFVAFLSESVRYLYLRENSIAYVDDVFKNLRDLQVLDLSQNNIRIIDFDNVFWIRNLNFSRNNIDTLVPATLSSRIEKIDLSHNRIKYFHEKNLQITPSYLDISCNKLSTVLLLVRHRQFLNVSNSSNLTITFQRQGGITDPAIINDLDLSFTNVFVNNSSKVKVPQRLSIKNHNIPVLTKPVLFHFTLYDSTEIDLSHSLITDIAAYCFESVRLRSLNLTKNKIVLLKNRVFYNSRIQTLDLSYSNITHIEKYAFSGAEFDELILRGNKLSNIKDVFNNVTIRKTLDLSHNPLAIIRKRSFENCSSVGVLILSHCNIDAIETEAFVGVDIQTINLSHNKLFVLKSNTFAQIPVENLILDKVHDIRSRAFSNMVNIKMLNLSNVDLSRLESYSFYNLPNAEIIDLRNNHISTIPSNLFIKMDRLRTVYLDGNDITTLNSLPNNVGVDFLSITFSGKFESNEMLNLNLKYLEIKYSNITHLTGNSFAGLYNLINLSFEKSEVEVVEDDALSNLFNLKVLDSRNLFRYTKVIKQGTFKDLKRLPFLNLSYLSLESLETKAFTGLGLLDNLLLNNNNITGLVGDTFFGLKSLISLNLSYCNVGNLNTNAFKGLENLKVLDLSFNNLVEIRNVFQTSLHNLQELHLQYNNISILHNISFKDLNNLTNLFLHGNSITEFSVDMFQYLPALKFLNFSNNLLHFLKSGSLSNLRSLQFLDISRNRLNSLENVDVFFSLRQLQVIKLDGNQLKELNVTKLLNNLKNVRQIGISYNKWKCETLSQIIETLNSKSISYRPDHPVYNDDNIDGVACIDICKFIFCSHKYIYEASHSY